MLKLSVRTKIIVGYVLFVVLIATFLVTNGRLLSSTVNHVERVFDESEAARLELETQNVFLKQSIAFIDFFLFEEDKYLTEFREFQQKFTAALDKLDASSEQNPKKAGILRDLRRHQASFAGSFERAAELYRANKKVEAAQIENGEMEVSRRAIEESMQTLIQLETADLEASMGEVRSTSKFVRALPFLSTTIENSETLYRDSVALQRSLVAESSFWRQVIALTSFFRFEKSDHGHSFHEQGNSFLDLVRQERPYIRLDEETSLLDEIEKYHDAFVKSFSKAENAWIAGEKAKALKLETGEIDPAEEAVEERLEQYYEYKQRHMDRALASVKLLDAEAMHVMNLFGGYVAILMVLGLGAGVAIAFRITRPVGKLAEAIKQVAKGDLAVRSTVSRNDEIGELSDSFNQMAEALQATMVSKSMLQVELVERTKIEAQLAAARDAALESSRIKSEFLANMSHEIRTPMNGIIGMTDLTLDTELSREQRDYLQMVKESADGLLGIINDILDFSKIEAGKFQLDPAAFNLHDVVNKTVKPLALRAQQKGLEMTCRLDPDVPHGVVGDPARLRQVLVNLVGNSIKFTEAGEISVLVEVESQTAEEVCLHFQIRDTGIGVPKEKQRLIFDAFAQADGSTTRKYGGTGLGLAITTQLVGLMGGRVWVESPVNGTGSGSIFHFTSWLGVRSEDESITTPAVLKDHKNIPPLNILLAEDNMINQRFAARLLEKYGHHVTVAENGCVALKKLEEQTFDILLMDVQMPEMNGLEATAAIRQREQTTNTHIPIIAMTAHALKGDRERCLSAGMDAYLAKPIMIDELLSAIEGFVTTESKQDRSARADQKAGGIDADDELLSFDSLISWADGDPALANELIEMFREDCPRFLADIREAIERGDAEALDRSAHTLKGALGYFTRGRATKAALRLQQIGVDGDLRDARKTMNELEQSVEQLLVKLEQFGKVETV
jgi:signal transduction histidine kinase/FixJ family two-component response regulator/HPt (histidine-containing phosphotransfer) domain-containing protein/CHASE3 domain sensor protein